MVFCRAPTMDLSPARTEWLSTRRATSSSPTPEMTESKFFLRLELSSKALGRRASAQESSIGPAVFVFRATASSSSSTSETIAFKFFEKKLSNAVRIWFWYGRNNNRSKTKAVQTYCLKLFLKDQKVYSPKGMSLKKRKIATHFLLTHNPT